MLLMTHLVTTLSIVFGFDVVNIVVFSFLLGCHCLRCPLLVASLIKAGYFQLDLKILLPDIRHMFITLT